MQQFFINEGKCSHNSRIEHQHLFSWDIVQHSLELHPNILSEECHVEQSLLPADHNIMAEQLDGRLKQFIS